MRLRIKRLRAGTPDTCCRPFNTTLRLPHPLPSLPPCARLNWLRSLQRQLGADDVAPSAQRIFFDPLVPGFTGGWWVAFVSGLGGVIERLGGQVGKCADQRGTAAYARISI